MDEARRSRGLSHKLGLGAVLLVGAAPFAAFAAWTTSPGASPGSHRVTDSFSDLMRRPMQTVDPYAPGQVRVEVADEVVDRNGRRIGPIRGARTIPTASIARGLVRGGPWGVAATLVVEAAFCKWETGTWALLCDAQQPAVVTDNWTWGSRTQAPHNLTYPTPLAYMQAVWPGGSNYQCSLGPVGTVGVDGYGFVPGRVATCTYEVALCQGCAPSVQTQFVQGAVLTQGTACPAVPGHPNPAYQVPGGPVDSVTGRCPTGVYGGIPEADSTPRLEPRIAPGLLPDVLGDVSRNHPGFVDAEAGGMETSGPGTIPGPTVTTTHTPPGGSPQVTTTTTNWTIIYQGDTIIINEGSTTVAPDGGTTTTETPTEIEFNTCGLPGQPPCQIDDSRMRFQSPGTLDPDAEAARDAAARDALAGSVQAPPSTWDFSLLLPPLAQCVPIDFAGLGQLDGCGMVDTVRGVMAYVWALLAAWFCIGLFSRTVRGG